MNYSKHKSNLIIYTLLFLSFLFSVYLWPKIILPYTNVHNVAGIYDNLKYSSHNDVTRYIFFIGFPVLTFLISLLLFKKEKVIRFKDLFKSNNEFYIINKYQKKNAFFLLYYIRILYFN